MIRKNKIVMLCVDDDFSKFIYNAINSEYTIEKVIVEESQSSTQLIKRRIKKLGIIKVIGQVLFKIFVVTNLNKKGAKRVSEIKQKYNLDNSKVPSSKLINVSSVNRSEVRELLEKINPDLILVNGTRIISKATINCVNAPYINIHVGITPKYRGVHGGYWAVQNNDLDLFGVTLHYIDEGVDTGQVIEQKVIKITDYDSFVTYPYLQIAEGIELVKRNIDEILEGKKIERVSLTNESKIWSSPSVW